MPSLNVACTIFHLILLLSLHRREGPSERIPLPYQQRHTNALLVHMRGIMAINSATKPLQMQWALLGRKQM